MSVGGVKDVIAPLQIVSTLMEGIIFVSSLVETAQAINAFTMIESLI